MNVPRWLFNLGLLPITCLSQSFQNLNFEAADVSGASPPEGAVPVASAFPHWQATYAAYYPSFGLQSGPAGAHYNSAGMDQIVLSIYDSRASSPTHPIFDKYTPYIEADLGSLYSGTLTLAQTGLIPLTAKSIQFVTSSYSSLQGTDAHLSFLVNGQSVPCWLLNAQPNYQTWGADVSAFAGTMAEISFAVSAAYPYSDRAYPHVFVGLGLDNITFSPRLVPEPGTTLLLALALGSLWGLRRQSPAGKQGASC